jgi:hypothetical protein
MNIICNNGVDIPNILQTETCNGEYKSTQCIIHPTAISYLNLPINSSQQTINNAFILALQYKDEVILALTERIEALEAP